MGLIVLRSRASSCSWARTTALRRLLRAPHCCRSPPQATTTHPKTHTVASPHRPDLPDDPAVVGASFTTLLESAARAAGPSDYSADAPLARSRDQAAAGKAPDGDDDGRADGAAGGEAAVPARPTAAAPAVAALVALARGGLGVASVSSHRSGPFGSPFQAASETASDERAPPPARAASLLRSCVLTPADRFAGQADEEADSSTGRACAADRLFSRPLSPGQFDGQGQQAAATTAAETPADAEQQQQQQQQQQQEEEEGAGKQEQEDAQQQDGGAEQQQAGEATASVPAGSTAAAASLQLPALTTTGRAGHAKLLGSVAHTPKGVVANRWRSSEVVQISRTKISASCHSSEIGSASNSRSSSVVQHGSEGGGDGGAQGGCQLQTLRSFQLGELKHSEDEE
jgi:hypothetical protein